MVCECKCIPIHLPDSYIEHGAPDILKEKYGLDAQSIAGKIRRKLYEGEA